MRKLILATTMVLVATGVVAKPKGSKPAPNEAIAVFAGHTETWETGNAQVYWSPNGELLVLWTNRDQNAAKYSIGQGKWSMTKRGTRCHEWTAKTLVNGKPQEFDAKKRCMSFVVDPDGGLWARETKPTRGDWHRVNTGKFVKGDAAKRQRVSEAKRMGVSF